jgi:signal transduction histidine kinase
VRRELLGRWIVPIRLIPLVLAIGYILLLKGPLTAEPDDWVLAVMSTLLIFGQGRWPLAILVLQTALLFVAPMARLGVGVVNMASLFALGELAWRRTGWQVWAGAVMVLGVGLAQATTDDFVPKLFRAILLIGALVLLGRHLRSVQEIAWHAKESAAAEAARADERTAIARELHDLVAHHVASMVLRIGVARHVLNPEPKVAQVLDEVHASGAAAMADLRTLVSVLRDPEGGHDAVTDLPTALQAAVERVEAAGPSVRTEIDPGVASLDAVLRLAVLRVVQEGLTNVLKHAGTKAKVLLKVGRDDQGVEVTLSDDGPGTPASPGHGLIGMRERVELAGGELVTGPAGNGWRVHARLPA